MQCDGPFVEASDAALRYIDTQPILIPIFLAAQLWPGTFKYAVNDLLDHAVDLSHFDARFRTDETGAPAYPRPLLLKGCCSPILKAS